MLVTIYGSLGKYLSFSELNSIESTESIDFVEFYF